MLWFTILYGVLSYAITTNAQGICDNAPTPALRITCQQITNWDANTRTVRPTTRTLVAAPGAAGISPLGVDISSVASSTTPSTVYDCLDIACICLFFGGTGGSSCTLPNGQTLRKAIRKEFRVMTDDERQNYITAMWTIKGNGDYDDIARIHSQFITSPGAHSGPAFLPWHREFIK
ncbi:Tyrosinase protein tyr-3, partial [Trichostrongylus colubriformis]